MSGIDIERGDIDEEKGAFVAGLSAPTEGADPAGLAELVVEEGTGATGWHPLVLRLRLSPSEQAQLVRLDEDEPRASLLAKGAVAPIGALGEIDVNLVTDCAAMAPSRVRFHRHAFTLHRAAFTSACVLLAVSSTTGSPWAGTTTEGECAAMAPPMDRSHVP